MTRRAIACCPPSVTVTLPVRPSCSSKTAAPSSSLSAGITPHGLASIFFDSTASRILGFSNVDVLVVPHDYETASSSTAVKRLLDCRASRAQGQGRRTESTAPSQPSCGVRWSMRARCGGRANFHPSGAGSVRCDFTAPPTARYGLRKGKRTARPRPAKTLNWRSRSTADQRDPRTPHPFRSGRRDDCGTTHSGEQQ